MELRASQAITGCATRQKEPGSPSKQWQTWTAEHLCETQGSRLDFVLPILAGGKYFKARSEMDGLGAGKHPGQAGSRHGGDLFLDRAGAMKR